ncbi:hypothetical protein C8F04DRAFT_1070192 [Mycena alexandri]|uniref:Uncharacterized protein n=1 Tax=Mycena alexandri TaxID=1745969 RepID=A0AAD6TI60_9AGAR|nr:hypothetical protein C8F04DRAFT_1070192 [Mycena alexandri]
MFNRVQLAAPGHRALQIQRNLTTLAHIYVVRKVLSFRENARKVSYLPGLRSLFSPASPLGVVLPTYFGNPGIKWQWHWRKEAYAKHGLQTMSVLGYLSSQPAVYTISMDVAKQVLALSLKSQLEKTEDSTSFIRFWESYTYSGHFTMVSSENILKSLVTLAAGHKVAFFIVVHGSYWQ